MRIKPSKRPKKRYIVFEVSKELSSHSAIINSIKKSASNVLGSKYQQAGIRFLKNKYRARLHKGILRVDNKYAKSLVEALNKNNIKTIGMSGVLKKAETKYLKTAS